MKSSDNINIKHVLKLNNLDLIWCLNLFIFIFKIIIKTIINIIIIYSWKILHIRLVILNKYN